jgi:large subunit ribosomal protein L30
VGQTKRSTGTLRALGLGRIGATSEHSDSPQLRGMVRRVRHLIRIEGEES